ncbi:hypothetical protein PLAN_100643 [Planktothrix rubescens CCAP 1459/22]|uniref:Uncharacterized protein n=2 Tax=Planktothrix TaxID=54304 RepID=A0A6J7ZH21_PLARU|nr:hypothetical protein PLAN_100643 [Planktothrix rubescens NIVA-CYA 18]
MCGFTVTCMTDSNKVNMRFSTLKYCLRYIFNPTAYVFQAFKP